MRILCDENVKRSIVTLLRQEGHEVERVQDELELGFDDGEIVEHCRERGIVLLTNDDDFFDFETHPGILFLDEQTTQARDAVTAVQRILRYVNDAERQDRIWHVPDGWD